MAKRFVIGPSQLGYLRADCERCFIREVAFGVKRPGSPPDAFNLADSAMKQCFDSPPGTVHELGVGPAFTVVAQGLHVQSHPISFASLDVEIVIKGRLDALVETAKSVRDPSDEPFERKTLIIDYKTSCRKDGFDSERSYSPQLHAYAIALEQPHAVQPPVNVDGLALLVYRPTNYIYRTQNKIAGLYGGTEWIDVTRDDSRFYVFLQRVAMLLSGTAQPQPNPHCAYCIFYGALPLITGARISETA